MATHTFEHIKEIPSVPENIVETETLIEHLRSVYGISDDLYGNILIALTEAVNNAIFHGNQCDIQKKVSIHYGLSEGYLVFLIEDEGAGFDFEHLPDPTNPENIEKLTGRGVFLMRQLSDGCRFLNHGSGVELKFKLQ